MAMSLHVRQRGRATGHTNDTLAMWGSSPSALALPSTCGSLIPSMSMGRWISAERAQKKPVAFARGELACQLLMREMLGQALPKPLINNQNFRTGVCFSAQTDKMAT